MTLFVGAALVTMVLGATVIPSRQAASSTVVTCTSIGLDPQRTWVFAPADRTWRVTHAIAGQARPVALMLPKATAAFDDDTVTLRARTANGGIDVTLSGTWQRATLDAYVNYELEVNVDASLTPEIDEISTSAPTGVRCERAAR